MRLVSENSEADLKRRRGRERFEQALIDAATNLLRIAAGAGKPEDLLREMAVCCEAATAEGYSAIIGDISRALDAGRREYERQQNGSPEDRKRWLEDGTLGVRDGALAVRIESLRVIAAQWSGNLSVERNAERGFNDAIQMFEDARAEMRSRNR